MATTARFVDDYFSASDDRVYWTGARVLDEVAMAIGFHLDGSKSAEDKAEMTILGTPGGTIDTCKCVSGDSGV